MMTQADAPNLPIRWGLVGLGWVATDFVAPAMQASAAAQIVACLGSTDEKTDAFARQFDVPSAHGTLEGLMSDPNVDAVYIALPNAMHRDAVLAGAAAGKHMLCEKPFAMSGADAVEMVVACERAGVT